MRTLGGGPSVKTEDPAEDKDEDKVGDEDKDEDEDEDGVGSESDFEVG